MKRKWTYSFMVLAFIFGLSVDLQAQDEAPLTDEELKKYAMVMDFADQEKAKLKESYNAMIQEQELMTGGKRFKELKAAGGDEAKLSEIGATPEEIEVFNTIEAANNENIAAFKEAYTTKIKDKEQLGAGLYNRISKALKTDTELKTRYTAIMEAIKSERASAEESAESTEGQ